ncbi:uncharacterized protein V1516DRAFT_679012 [Lipomyces oligophaga]|uniref:uncharacterized protein n=1 Tax=Lipomyces oligophaga TaxID=45792 RepID=UPI0034CFC2DE
MVWLARWLRPNFAVDSRYCCQRTLSGFLVVLFLSTNCPVVHAQEHSSSLSSLAGTSSEMTALNQSVSSTASSGFFSRIVWLLPHLVLNLIALVTYYLPAQIFGLLGTSFSITLSFSSLLMIILGVGTAVWAYVRYRYLNIYSRLPVEPPRQESKIDMMMLPTNLAHNYEKPGFSSYLDEFFSGIKIFGYLEKPVFYELTRHVQTRKLIAGDTILLEEENGFCIVVDGEIQIWARTGPSDHSTFTYDEEDDDEANGDYQLLTEVKNGAPMSSLFSILSLFTESIDIVSQRNGSQTQSQSLSSPSPPLNNAMSEESSTLHSDSGSPGLLPVPNIPPLSDRHSSSYERYQDRPQSRSSTKPTKPLNSDDIIARATIDSTIAIIPAEAFRRLTQKFPKSAASIVQVILARFRRVTFQTGHSYLGLTSEILKTEIAFNKFSKFELPNYLGDDMLAEIKSQFVNPEEPVDDESLSPKSWTSSKRRQSAFTINNNNERSKFKNSRDRISAGDLMANVSTSSIKTSGHASASGTARLPKNHLGSYGTLDVPDDYFGLEDDTSLNESRTGSDRFKEDYFASSHHKEAILDCILSALGVGSYSIVPPRSSTASVENSPRLGPFDSRRSPTQRSLLSARSANLNGIGSFGPLGLGGGLNQNFPDDESASSSFSTTPSQGMNFTSLKKLLAKDVQILHYKPGSRIVNQGEPSQGLYYVIDGFLAVSSQTKYGNTDTVYTIKPGGIGGYLGTIVGYTSFVNIRATTNAYVGFLPKTAFDRLIDQQPIVLLTMAKRLTSVLSSLIMHIDFALEWLQVGAGEILYRQGNEADSIYIVLSGRLRALETTATGEVELRGEFGLGDSVGELEVLTSSKRPVTLHAVRDTELVRFTRTLFESLSMRNPAITIQISRIIASRVDSLVKLEVENSFGISKRPRNSLTSASHYRTVAIVPVTNGLPCKDFAHKLARSFSQFGESNILLDQEAVLKYLGRHSFNKLGQLKLSSYLTDLEERYHMVLYVVDTAVSSHWTQTCMSQADCILLLADANADPGIGEYERVLLTMKTTAHKELVLLHHDRYVPAGQTNNWLKSRTWIHLHHHVQMVFRPPMSRTSTAAFGTRFINLKNRVQTTLQLELQKYNLGLRTLNGTAVYSTGQVNKDDFNRLARILSGKAVGLVLGGGGARGLSHLGVIKYLEEAGIPIDIVGGTSIGAFVGGLYAKDSDMVPIYGRLKKFSGRIGSLWRMFFDLTYPATSYTTGHEFNRGIWKAFGDSRIEDFWLQYYTNTTNITHSKMEIHTSGYAWRYIRASMSLAGLLPPITDDGSMLLDGGYVDNLTVTHMKSLGASVVFAVDVGSVDDTTPMKWGDSLSGFWVLFNRFNIFSRQPSIPSMAEIQARLAYVSSVGALERAKTTPGCVYIRPPIEGFKTLDFAKFGEISEVGYIYAKQFFAQLENEGKFPRIPGMARKIGEQGRRIVQRRNSI